MFMPFIHQGGFFIPTTSRHALGDELMLVLTLMDSRERIPVTGRVIWLTPAQSHDKRTEGIGIRFDSNCEKTRGKLEHFLQGRPEKNSTSFTL